ncbi:MAG: PH domain-containing protein [Sandaracinus sp.]|nr:PH domain-containing protein [Sandaracinus sp.]
MSDPSEATDAPIAVRQPKTFLERVTGWSLVGYLVADLVEKVTFAPAIGTLGLMAVAGLATLGARLGSRPEHRRIRVDADVLRLEDSTGAVQTLPLGTIRHAEICYVGRKPRLRLLSENRAILLELHLDTTEEVASWIRSLGLERRARELTTHVRFTALPPAEVGAMLLAAGSVYGLGLFGGGLQSLFALAMLGVLGFANPIWRKRVVVGAEGVEVRSWRGRVFHRFDDVEDVVREGLRVFLVRRDGTRVALPVAREEQAEGLVADAHWTLQKALLAYREAPDLRALDVLARGERSVSEWLAHLEGLAGGDYRSAALTRDRLEAAVADPRADESVRAGAAWLLARQGHDASVRVARDRAAAPRVRVALEAALEENVEAFDEASRMEKTASS